MIPVFLSIDRSQIGAWRAARVFQCCRAFAHRIAPRCFIQARYVDHERVGWDFQMPNQGTALALRLFHKRLMGGPKW
ncbi:hypothetical protein GCM10011504_37770 [Siccirubricoccus deserti]|nr:hypothetical protein GCM10011504_37770 [Siccirubricoccus deserti]